MLGLEHRYMLECDELRGGRCWIVRGVAGYTSGGVMDESRRTEREQASRDGMSVSCPMYRVSVPCVMCNAIRNVTLSVTDPPTATTQSTNLRHHDLRLRYPLCVSYAYD